MSPPPLFTNSLGIDKMTPSDNDIPKYAQMDTSISSTNTHGFNVICQKTNSKLGFQPHRWQVGAISEILNGADMVVNAGTGFGKSLCFQALPIMRMGAIVLVITPTIALMEDQAISM